MIIKVAAEIYLDIGDRDPEEVCSSLASGLSDAIDHFPMGDVVETDVSHFESLSAEEVKERGFEE